jgi:hypothetical protein
LDFDARTSAVPGLFLPAIPSNRCTPQCERHHRPRGRPASTGNLKGTYFKSDFGNFGVSAPSSHKSLPGEEIASFLRKMNDLPLQRHCYEWKAIWAMHPSGCTQSDKKWSTAQISTDFSGHG